MTHTAGEASCYPGFPFPTAWTRGSGETSPRGAVLAWGRSNVVNVWPCDGFSYPADAVDAVCPGPEV